MFFFVFRKYFCLFFHTYFSVFFYISAPWILLLAKQADLTNFILKTLDMVVKTKNHQHELDAGSVFRSIFQVCRQSAKYWIKHWKSFPLCSTCAKMGEIFCYCTSPSYSHTYVEKKYSFSPIVHDKIKCENHDHGESGGGRTRYGHS